MDNLALLAFFLEIIFSIVGVIRKVIKEDEEEKNKGKRPTFMN